MNIKCVINIQLSVYLNFIVWNKLSPPRLPSQLYASLSLLHIYTTQFSLNVFIFYSWEFLNACTYECLTTKLCFSVLRDSGVSVCISVVLREGVQNCLIWIIFWRICNRTLEFHLNLSIWWSKSFWNFFGYILILIYIHIATHQKQWLLFL